MPRVNNQKVGTCASYQVQMSKPNSILALRVPPVNGDAVYIRGVPHSDSALRSSRMYRVADKEEELKRLQCLRSSIPR